VNKATQWQIETMEREVTPFYIGCFGTSTGRSGMEISCLHVFNARTVQHLCI